jgi:1-phosphofructokinase family hexose kinase
MPSHAPSRIVTVGLSPVWQHILEFDDFQPGQVNRAVGSTWCASGKSLNVAIGIHHLGGELTSVSIAGGSTGGAIQRQFEAAGIDAQWVETESPTRVCTTILDRASGKSTELVENQPPLTEAELRELRQLARAETARSQFVVLSGSLPAGCPESFYADLMHDAGETQFLIDAQGPALTACLPLRPLLVKPNRDELERTLRRSFSTNDELIAGMKELNAAGAQWVVITDGAHPVWVTSVSETHCLPIVPVKQLVNPIACGDALMAGLAWGLSRGRPTLESIHIGFHCAAQNAADLLPCQLRAGDLPQDVKQRPTSPAT